jgi:hypothetical protein
MSSKEKTQTENVPSEISNPPNTITESEWMCRTPSPVKNSKADRYENMWEPSPGHTKNVDNGKRGMQTGSPVVRSNGLLNSQKKADGTGLDGIPTGSSVHSFDGAVEANIKLEGGDASTQSMSARPNSLGSVKVSKSDKRISSKERLSKKAMEWYDQVRTPKDESTDPTASVDEVKARTGWI